MAYAAVICAERTIEELINSPRISLSPPCKQMMEVAYQQLKSCQAILKRLDRSSKAYCRKKVNAVDARIKEGVWEFQDLIESHVNNQILSQSDQILRYDVHLHELTPGVDDFTRMRLWVVEGFLEPNKKEKLEDSAQMYLGELIDNSVVIRCQTSTKFPYILVMLLKDSSDSAHDADSVKTCRLQSAFWHLCYREARKSKFFNVSTSVGDGVEENMKSQRRLSFHNNILFGIKDVYDSLQHGCASTARSLLCFGPFYPYTVPVCFSLRLLKLLDALRIRFYEFPIQVLQLIHLKHLALTYNGELPVAISKLWNLQVLIIHRYMSIIKSCGAPSYVPMEICDMQELKHIHIMGTNLPTTSRDTSLDNLLTLVGVGARTCTKEVLERIPNLRKLGIQIELLPDDDMKSLHCLNLGIHEYNWFVAKT